MRPWISLAFLVICCCSRAQAPVPAATTAARAGAPGLNVLLNPGFEQGPENWTRMGGQSWGAFSIVQGGVHSGSRAAQLNVLAPAGSIQPKSKVFGVVQEVRGDALPGAFPETLSGWYRVDRWSGVPAGAFLYMQAVVIAWGDPRTTKLVPGTPDINNYQIRFILAGTPTAPFALTNARFEFLTREAPKMGEWVFFDIPVRQKFLEDWGVVPDKFEFVRLLFEARWDGLPEGTPVDAQVTYDDLFFGYGDPRAAKSPGASGPSRDRPQGATSVR